MHVAQLLDTEGLPDTLDNLAAFMRQHPIHGGAPMYFFLEAITEGATAREAFSKAKIEFEPDDTALSEVEDAFQKLLAEAIKQPFPQCLFAATEVIQRVTFHYSNGLRNSLDDQRSD